MLIFGYEVELDAHILVTGAACASDFTRVARSDDSKLICKATSDLERLAATPTMSSRFVRR